MINVFEWNKTDEATKARILKRSGADIDMVIGVVQPIIADVKRRGDDALRDYARKFENAEINNIKASEEEFAHAGDGLDEELKAAIQHCVNNVKKFHAEQMRRVELEREWMIEIEPGVMAGEKITAIESVGLYVPRGRGAFPSALYMLAIPAVLAGVKEIAVVTPPTPEGSVDEATLYTAKLCGITNIYKCGGAQAIAALAYGTDTVPKVRKVLGPGSAYVAAAKRILSDVIDPGMPAGPSESIILADGTADPHNTCLDVLNEAEHGDDSAVLLITHDENLAAYVQQNLPGVIAQLPEPRKTICAKVMSDYGGIVLTESLEESIALANEYAAEHLHLKVKDLEETAAKLHHAGEILMGELTPSSFGNYGIGVNHVLPTGGWAHTYSCTSVWDFLKRTSLARMDKQGFDALKGPVTTMTDYEGFPAHGDVIRKRNI